MDYPNRYTTDATVLRDFFKEYRLQQPYTEAAANRIRSYVLYGNRTKGITTDRRADIVRQKQIEWNGQRVMVVYFTGQRTGTVRFIKPCLAPPRLREPTFEAVVYWDEPVSANGLRTTTINLNSLALLKS